MRIFFGFSPILSIPTQGYPLSFLPWIDKADSFNNSCFTFLNQKLSFSNSLNGINEEEIKINWNELNFGNLWAYNLNYMDYLLQPGIVRETGLILIKNFINDLEKNKIGLDPYPISLRSVNWIKFLSGNSKGRSGNVLKLTNSVDSINASLYAQYQILLKNLEFHLLGNHLLENGFSLLFGAFYFHDEKIWHIAKKLLEKELEEQILQDGAHFELSPMYHQIITDRLLDCINLVKNNKQFDGEESLLGLFERKAAKMLSWLNAVTFSSGEIPLFNDSAFEIAPTTRQLNEYASRLEVLHKDSPFTTNLIDSGYRKFYSKDYECLFDLGEIGPHYQPGHAHADTFSFELYVGGKPFIVDTGTSTYNPGKRRLLERGTISHNTVTVSDEDSSYIWASHRVGNRASVKSIIDEIRKASVSHSGYRRFNSIVIREIETTDHEIRIYDKISPIKNKSIDSSPNSSRIVTSRLHLHPHRKASLKNQILSIDGQVEIIFTGLITINQCEYYYAPEFNKLVKSWVYEITFDKELLTIIKIGNLQ